jgi:hypothetical protein
MDPPAVEPAARPPPQEGQSRELSAKQRKQIVSTLLWELKDSPHEHKFRRGVITAVARMFHVNPRTIRRVWARVRENFRVAGVFSASPLKKNCGAKQKWNHDEVRAAVAAVPMHQKRTLRDLAAALGIPLTTLFCMKQCSDKVIMPITGALKPALTPEHMLKRVLFACEKLNPDDLMFEGFYDTVHVDDEKWFFLSESQLRIYVAATGEEEVPTRACQNRNHIIKVMFLCAIARPRFNANGECVFDGKIGMWPFVERVEAARTSIHRPRGTMVTKPVSVTRTKYREFMVQNVIPSIKEKWPDRNRNIVIQQDGASAHISMDDPDFVAAATDGLWNIKLENQPPKSPDTNVLDLSLFRALQSDQWRSGFAYSIDELIEKVQSAFLLFDPRKIDFGFITLQCCLDDILGLQGRNDYKIRHIGKGAMLRQGNLPQRIIASGSALEIFNRFMNGGGDEEELENAAAEDDGNGVGQQHQQGVPNNANDANNL